MPVRRIALVADGGTKINKARLFRIRRARPQPGFWALIVVTGPLLGPRLEQPSEGSRLELVAHCCSLNNALEEVSTYDKGPLSFRTILAGGARNPDSVARLLPDC